MNGRPNNRRVLPIVLVAVVLVALGLAFDWTPPVHADDFGATPIPEVTEDATTPIEPVAAP